MIAKKNNNNYDNNNGQAKIKRCKKKIIMKTKLFCYAYINTYY